MTCQINDNVQDLSSIIYSYISKKCFFSFSSKTVIRRGPFDFRGGVWVFLEKKFLVLILSKKKHNNLASIWIGNLYFPKKCSYINYIRKNNLARKAGEKFFLARIVFSFSQIGFFFKI